jgi:hypothetical protein
MLRCAILRRLPKNPQASCRKSPRYRQSLVGKLCHQTRSLSFLPIVSSHDTAQEKSSRDELEKLPPIQISDERSVPSPTVPGLIGSTSIESSRHIIDADSRGDTPAQANYFSASLADGTIIHSSGPRTLSEFEGLVSVIAKVWKQYSQDISSQVSAQNIGMEIWGNPEIDSTVSARIYEMEVGRGLRKRYYYTWFVPTNTTNIEILKSGILSGTWPKTRKSLVKALKTHVGSVDQHGSLSMLSPPGPHPLHSAFKKLVSMFAYSGVPFKDYAWSVVLDASTIVSPIPPMEIESNEFKSLAAIIWQWLQQDSLLREALSKDISHVQIMYVS